MRDPETCIPIAKRLYLGYIGGCPTFPLQVGNSQRRVNVVPYNDQHYDAKEANDLFPRSYNIAPPFPKDLAPHLLYIFFLIRGVQIIHIILGPHGNIPWTVCWMTIWDNLYNCL